MKSSSRSGGTNRGGIRKRGPTRTDRDGDMDMDGSGPRGGRRGRGSGGGRSTTGRLQTHGRADAIEKAITTTHDTKDTQANIRRNQKSTGSNLEQLSVRGWKQSKAASNRDGGVESLLAFLERRMNSQSKGPRVKITKVCSEFEMAVTIHELCCHPLQCIHVWKHVYWMINHQHFPGMAHSSHLSPNLQCIMRLSNI